MRIKRFITLTLITILMLVLGSVPLSLASHSIDHHHHSAQTHTTGICAWMCTAAQTISTESQIFLPEISLLDILQPVPISSLPTIHQYFFPSRAPPI